MATLIGIIIVFVLFSAISVWFATRLTRMSSLIQAQMRQAASEGRPYTIRHSGTDREVVQAQLAAELKEQLNYVPDDLELEPSLQMDVPKVPTDGVYYGQVSITLRPRLRYVSTRT